MAFKRAPTSKPLDGLFVLAGWPSPSSIVGQLIGLFFINRSAVDYSVISTAMRVGKHGKRSSLQWFGLTVGWVVCHLGQQFVVRLGRTTLAMFQLMTSFSCRQGKVKELRGDS